MLALITAFYSSVVEPANYGSDRVNANGLMTAYQQAKFNNVNFEGMTPRGIALALSAGVDTRKGKVSFPVEVPDGEGKSFLRFLKIKDGEMVLCRDPEND